jgi:hypothetical protein
MKKLFLAITLAAAVATTFMSCNKTTTDSETHTQKYTLGATTFDINNAFTIDITGLTFSGISGTPTMQYAGTLPKFDFPFQE